MPPSEDTLAERTRTLEIVVRVSTNPTPANIVAAIKAIRNGVAVEDFTPPDPTLADRRNA